MTSDSDFIYKFTNAIEAFGWSINVTDYLWRFVEFSIQILVNTLVNFFHKKYLSENV